MPGVLTSVAYIDPWGTTTPGTVQTGVVAKTSSNPTNTVLAGCLVLGSTPIVSAIGAANNMVRILPTAPLSPQDSYSVWLQWVPVGATTGQLVWPIAGMVTAALVISIPAITSIAVTSGNVAGTWMFGAGAGGVAGANLQFFDQTGGSGGYIQAQGGSGSKAINLSASKTYVAYIQSVQPANLQVQGGFTAPFAYGPWSAPIPVPSAAPAITAISYDNGAVSATWSSLTIPTAPAPSAVAYSLILSSGGAVVGAYASGPGGGIATVGNLAGQTIQAAGQVRFGPATGPTGAGVTLITATPAITAATVTVNSGQASIVASLAALTGLPTGTVLVVSLLQDGVVVTSANASGSAPTATLTATPVAGARYTLSARAVLSGPPTISGPKSAPAPIILQAPSAPLATYDGATLTVLWPPMQNPAVTGYTTTVTISGVATVYSGPESALALPLLLAPGASAAITVQASNGLGLGPLAAATYVAPSAGAPTMLSASVADTIATLKWTPSTALGVDGYSVTFRGVTSGQPDTVLTVQTGVEPTVSARLPVDAFARTWTATVQLIVHGAAVAGAQVAATLLTAIPVVSETTVTSASGTTTASVQWGLSGYDAGMNSSLQTAQLLVQLLDGGEVISAQTVAAGTGGTVPVVLPAPPPARLSVAAQLIAPALAGPRGSSSSVLGIAPTGLAAAYDGVAISLAWAGGGEGITGHRIVLTPSTGTALTFDVGTTTSARITTPLTWGPTWSATVQPFGETAMGLASGSAAITLPVITTPVISATWSDGQTVKAVWSRAGQANVTYIATLTAGGSTIASQNAGSALTTELALPAAPPADAVLTVTALIGEATGPTSTGAAVLMGAPCITSATLNASKQVSVVWTAPTGGTLSQVVPVVSWPGGEVALTAAAAASPTTFAWPAAAPNGATVSLIGLNGLAVGPTSAGVVAPLVSPTNLTLAYDGTNVTANWDPSSDGGVDGYVAALTVNGGSPTNTPSSQPGLTIPYTPSGSTPTATVAVAAVSGVGTGGTGAAVSVISATAALATATHDGTSISLTWTPAAAAPATATRISLLAEGATISVADVVGGAVTLDAPAGPVSVTVQAVGAATSGPVAAAVALLTQTPVIQDVAFDPASGVVTATWLRDPNAQTYDLVVMAGETVVVSKTGIAAGSAATVSTTIPAGTLLADAVYGLTIRPHRTDGGCVITGPSTVALPVLSRPPLDLEIDFDGATLQASWTTVPDPGVIGYRVSQVSGGTVTDLGDAPGERLTATLTTWTASDTITVQPLAVYPTSGAVTVVGPSISAPLTRPGLFLSSSGAAPHIAPASTTPVTPQDIVILLPDLFSSTPASLPDVAPFVLTLIDAEPTPPWQPGLFYKLTLAADSSAWVFPTDPPTAVRTDLWTAWRSFLNALHTAGATAIGIATVQDAVSRAMPQTFTETLLYAYGATFDQGYFDLRPGMILRAEYEVYQSLGSQPDSKYLSGFVTSGVAEYAMASYAGAGSWCVGLDSYLARLGAARGVVVTPAPGSGTKSYGGGGVLDGFFTQFQQPFLRLVYPPNLLGDDSTGSALEQRNPVLLGSDNLSDLDSATASLRAGQPPGGSVASFYLRGRVTFIPMIDVLVNGMRQRVSVGFTVGDLLAGRASRPPIAGLSLTGVRLTRPSGAAILQGDSTVSYAAGHGLDVRLDWTGGNAYGAASDWLDLPLLHGDRIDIADGAP